MVQILIGQNVVVDKFHHCETIHVFAFRSNDGGKQFVRFEESSIVWLLQVVPLDVLPDPLWNLSPGSSFTADDGLQVLIHSDPSSQDPVTRISSPPKSFSESFMSGWSFRSVLSLDQVVLVEVPASLVFPSGSSESRLSRPLTCLGLLFFHFLEELNLMQLFTFVANWDTAVSRNWILR